MPPDTGRMRMSSGEVAAHHETADTIGLRRCQAAVASSAEP